MLFMFFLMFFFIHIYNNMNNKEKTKNNEIENIINEFIKKIYELDKSSKSLEDKLTYINVLLNNLIDFCIKKKIFYYVENKIGYNNIVNNFKVYLIKFIKNLVDPSGNIIGKYITKDNDNDNDNSSSNANWDNVSDINSIMFKNFKKLNESFEKNVSFGDSIQITNYDEGFDGFELNYKSKDFAEKNKNNYGEDDKPINYNLMNFGTTNTNTNTNTNNNNNNNDDNDDDIDNLPLYIKILINQNKFLVEFIEKIILMCKILSDNDIKYKKINPYD